MQHLAPFRALALLSILGSFCHAAEYPKPIGYVNDYAGLIATRDRVALEEKLQAFEQATGNEVTIAVVPSLEGESIERYAQGLFRDWGIGKRGENNGVLFLWAPKERQVRIQTGYGVESRLTDREAAAIVRKVTRAFRGGDFTSGLQAAVNGIEAELSGHRDADESATRMPRGFPLALLGGIAGLGAVVFVVLQGAWTRKLRRDLPARLQTATASLDRTESLRDAAAEDLAVLQRDAPEEVWQDLESAPAAGRDALRDLRARLVELMYAPQDSSVQIRQLGRSFKTWSADLARITAQFGQIGTRREQFEESRREAQEMLDELGAGLSLAGCGNDRARKLADATRSTFDRAARLASQAPVNWLLVYDLLVDVQQSLLRLPDLGGSVKTRHPVRPARRWKGSADCSDAATLMTSYWPLWATATTSGGDASGFSGFSGGDCGGGGASGSY